jgi:hypothetical protein
MPAPLPRSMLTQVSKLARVRFTCQDRFDPCDVERLKQDKVI